ncbi:MAG: insulinase family protein [Burkholderiaceae bacterium]|nr:insulinase family protein [Burkholderiaceae bacterium]
MLKRSIALFLYLMLGIVGTGAQASPLKPTLDKTLSNGMRVLVFENARAPTALHMVWVKAGSIDETNGRSGLAHVLEHMMFKGTKNLAPGEFSRRVAALGGRENAFTSKDYTGYFQQIHKDSLREVMRLEADRQRFLKLDEQEFKKEVQVVMEERRLRTDDSPAALAHETLLAQAFQASPVRNPIIGWMNDLEHLSIADVQDWYRSWYAPNNMILVVAGDVKADQVFAWAQQFYGPMPSRALPKRKPQEEPDQNGLRRVKLKAPAQNAFLMMAYKAPTLRESLGPLLPSATPARDLVALDVLSALLDDPGTGRLVRRLVREERIAVSVGTDTDGVSRGPGLFMVQATAAPGVALSTLETRIKEEIAKIAKEGVEEKELQRVKRQAKASQVFRQDSMFSIAMESARLLLAGRSIEDAERWLAVLDDIRSEDIQRVAKQFFVDDQLTALEFEPLPLAEAAARPKPSGTMRH